MLLDRSLYERLVNHAHHVIGESLEEQIPFPHILIKGVFPTDVFQQLLTAFPSSAYFTKANPKHHTNEYGGSTRQRMNLTEASLDSLSDPQHILWATVRAAFGSAEVRDIIFLKLANGLCRRFGVDREHVATIPAFPRGQLYSETDGYRIAPHPDTREKIVTMQFAFPSDNSLVDVGTEFYSRSFNPMSYLREPRGFTIAKAMPFLPNHAYAFSVLNDIGLKSWHGRSTIPPMNCVRNTLLHIWYAEPDETDRELAAYQKFLRSPVPLRKSA